MRRWVAAAAAVTLLGAGCAADPAERRMPDVIRPDAAAEASGWSGAAANRDGRGKYPGRPIDPGMTERAGIGIGDGRGMSRSGAFQTVIPPVSAPAVPEHIRGIYVSGWAAGSKSAMERLIGLVERTDLNAMVIDVKNEYGRLTYRSTLPEVRAVGADREPLVSDMAALLQRLKAKNIYTIGRLVVFKDPLLASAKPEWAFHKKDGTLWRDRKGQPWVEPFRPEVRAYNIAVAKEAAALGFDEIQFDYVRFPDNGEEMDRTVRYRNPEGWTKQEAIARFLRDAREALHAAGTPVSADVFGLVTTARDDMGIGQTWRDLAPAVDVISPMVYPSHYAAGSYGIRSPDLDPSGIVRRSLEDAVRRNAVLSAEGLRPAQIRPWLQAFTAAWVKPHRTYREAEIQEQIRAAAAAGVHSFLLWSPSCRYDYRRS